MNLTKSLVRAKNPCADGFRWYLRNHRDGSDYQQVLDDLVQDGRIGDACWLLDKLGPTQAVLKLEQLDGEVVVYAGSIEVQGNIEVGSLLRAGGSIRCGGAIRAGQDVVAGEDIRAAGGVRGAVPCGAADPSWPAGMCTWPATSMRAISRCAAMSGAPVG
jgi:hypothetical protein